MIMVDILIFLVVLGLLIFFHELGHFVAAKACGVYCDRFSLGMPPRLFGVRIGETDYCVGALPLGGYVKMAGQEDVPTTDEEREETYAHVPPERWFNNRPLWQRFIVILAGPMMNLVLAVVLYGIIAAVGAMVPEAEVDNRIGRIEPGSPAAKAQMYLISGDKKDVDYARAPDAVGWQVGDRVVDINDSRITNIGEAAIDAILGAGKVLEVEIERVGDDGALERYLCPVEPRVIPGTPHARFGIAPFRTPLVDHIMEDSPAEKSGLQEGDIIARANGEVVDRSTFIALVETTPEVESLSLDIERGAEEIEIVVQPRTVGRFRGFVTDPPINLVTHETDDAKPVVALVSDEQDRDGLQRRDVIEKINGQPATVALLYEIEQANPGGTVEFNIRRPALLYGYVREEETLTVKVAIPPVRAIGIQFGTKMVFHRVPPARVAPEAFRQSYQAIRHTLQILAMLVSGNVSPKELGGPVLIYQVTTTAAREGYWWLVKITAFISVNLCVFNLLPVPVLDGGLLLVFVIEGVRRKPLNMKVQQIIQQMGLVLIIGIILFVTFNDVSRLIARWMP